MQRGCACNAAQTLVRTPYNARSIAALEWCRRTVASSRLLGTQNAGLQRQAVLPVCPLVALLASCTHGRPLVVAGLPADAATARSALPRNCIVVF